MENLFYAMICLVTSNNLLRGQRMKIVVAIDSLKGSLSSMEAGAAAREGILRVLPDANVVLKPIADGGEGTTEALVQGLGGKMVAITVQGPLGRPLLASYGFIENSHTAILEMATAAGITIDAPKDRRPHQASTYGVGEMIRDGMQKGCRKFIIGIGGSATNDGGIGMLKALGVRFLDEHMEPVGAGAQALAKVAHIDASAMLPQLKECHFHIACDVNNPLCGETGATYIFGPQKGLTSADLPIIDEAMRHFACKVMAVTHTNHLNTAGAGAAGGLGFAFLSFLNSILSPGIDVVLEAISLEAELLQTDLVITGEGRLDAQTAMGKAPIGIARLAKQYHCFVIAFAGSVADDAGALNQAGIDAFFPIVRGITSLEEAMSPVKAATNLSNSVEQALRLLSFHANKSSN